MSSCHIRTYLLEDFRLCQLWYRVNVSYITDVSDIPVVPISKAKGLASGFYRYLKIAAVIRPQIASGTN